MLSSLIRIEYQKVYIHIEQITECFYTFPQRYVNSSTLENVLFYSLQTTLSLLSIFPYSLLASSIYSQPLSTLISFAY